jgi:hypothetical protein
LLRTTGSISKFSLIKFFCIIAISTKGLYFNFKKKRLTND